MNQLSENKKQQNTSYLTPKQMANDLTVTTRSLRTYQSKGQIPFIKLNSKIVRFDPVAVRAALKKLEVNAN
jgi:predicted site-specific integrase-resolvase